MTQTTPVEETPPRQSARPKRGDELVLKVDSLAHGGEGVARWGPGGYVVFVAGAVPGDVVRALVYKPKRSYAHARALEILEPSPERIEPRAEHPGVPWQVLPYERQLQIKHEQVGDALRRIGHLEGFVLEDIVPAVEQWRYRNKLEYSFGVGEAPLRSAVMAAPGHPPADEDIPGHPPADEDTPGHPPADEDTPGHPPADEDTPGHPPADEDTPGHPPADEDTPGHPPADGGELVCGFHASAGGNRVVAITDCLLASELGNLARDTAAAWAREQGLGAWTRGEAPTGEPLLRNLVVREGRHTGRVQVRLVSTPGEIDVYSLAETLRGALGEQLSGLLWTRSSQIAETTMGGETELVSGDAELPERLGELDLRISHEAFFQTNTEMTEALYSLVAEYAALEGWERVFDLYCGIGTIGLTLAPRAGELWGIELIEEAVANAIAAARRNEITNTHFFAGDTRLALPELLEKAGRPDVIVVDPPRAGLSGKVVRRIIDASPKRIVYVSCNPTTLAPNAAQLVEAGWTLRKVRPVDMFPQTHHVECVALFERTAPQSPALPDDAASP